VTAIISYAPFWETLKTKGISTYALVEKHRISSETINRLRHGKGISTTKIDDLCKILECKVEDLILYVPDGGN
jgi:DNA-binding Xre family transcriptional regulator